MFQIHMDEYQTYNTDEDLKSLLSPETKNRIPLRRFCYSLLRLSMQAADNSLFFFPLFTGTLDLNYVTIFPATHYCVRTISLKPGKLYLSFSSNMKASDEAILNVLENSLQQMPIWKMCTANSFFPQMVAALGGVFRACEFLITILGQKKEFSPNEVWKDLCEM